MSANPEAQRIKGLYDPETGMVACVLIHAAFGLDHSMRRVNNIFDARDWFTAPRDSMVMMEETVANWELVASMPREDRPNLKGGRVGGSLEAA